MTGLAVVLAVLACAQAETPPGAEIAGFYQEYAKGLPALEFVVDADGVVDSLESPGVPLRRVEGHFVSQMVFGKALTHRVVLLIPTDPGLRDDPARRGRVVIVGSIASDFQQTFECDYAYPIATRLGYPTMILPNPGETPDRPGREWSIGEFWGEGVPRTLENSYFFRLAIPYVRAVDVFAQVLGIPAEEIRAVIGGHSKRAPSALVAAAIRPANIAGVVFMGMEGRWQSAPAPDFAPVSPPVVAAHVAAPVLYLGATNEDGYTMFNVTRNQAMLGRPWTVSMVPNYRHAAESPQQFLIWQMWAAHVLGGRPVARVSDPAHEETERGTIFRARVEDANHIVQVRAWYAYCDDVPLWRDVVWYPVVMRPTKDGLYEGYESGKTPDAWFCEVEDIGGGVHGYVTSCPQNITGLPTEERTSRGSRSRLWSEKAPAQ